MPGKRPQARWPAGRLGQKARRNLSAYGFLIGAILCFTFFSWYPIVREVILSFQKAVYGGGYTWAGWINYDRIVHDPTFWLAWPEHAGVHAARTCRRVRGPVLRGDLAE